MISPGSQVTLAQLGLPESFTPAKLRLASRMFPALEPGTWTWTKVREAREGEKDRLLATVMARQDDDDDDDDDEEEDDEEEEDEEEAEEGDEATAKPEDDSTEKPKTSAPAVAGAIIAATEDTAKLDISEKREAKAGEEIATTMKDEVKPSLSELKAEDSEMMDVAGEQEEEAEDEEEEEEEDDDEEDDEEDEDMGDVYVEDEDDEEGAVWCMKEGKVVDWGCFFALL